MSRLTRKLRHLSLSAVLFVCAGVAVVFGIVYVANHLPKISLPAILSHIGIVRDRDIRTSRALLAKLKPLYALDTVEVVYDVVFPFDFMDERLDIQSIINAVRSGGPSELLTAAEEEYLSAYNLSHSLGLETGPDHYDFVVVTVCVRAGIDLSPPAIAHPELASKSDVQHWMNADEGTVRIRIPDAQITDIRIEDPSTGAYSFPDRHISPDGWRKIASFVNKRVEHRVLQTDILFRAHERAKKLAASFLYQAGFDTVTIVQ